LIRCGYIAGRAGWIAVLLDLQVATNFGGPSPVSAELVTRTRSDGSYRKHLEALRRRLFEARRAAGTRLAAPGIQRCIMPRGGFHLWCRLQPLSIGIRGHAPQCGAYDRSARLRCSGASAG